MGEEDGADVLGVEIERAARLVVPLRARVAKAVPGRERPAIELEHPQPQPAPVEGRVCELAMKVPQRAREGARGAAPALLVQREQRLEVGVDRRQIITEPKAKLAELGELALATAHLLAKIAAAASEKPLPVHAADRDHGARLGREDLRPERRAPALVRGHLLADEQIAADRRQVAFERLGHRLAVVRPADRRQPIRRPVPEQPGHSQGTLASDDKRNLPHDRAIRPRQQRNLWRAAAPEVREPRIAPPERREQVPVLRHQALRLSARGGERLHPFDH